MPPTAPSAARPAVEFVLPAHGEPRTARRSSACFPERGGRFLQLRRLAWASVRECPLLERSVRYGARRFAWRSSPVVVDDLDVVPVRVEHERAVVARVVDRALARRAVVLVARRERGGVERAHRGVLARGKRELDVLRERPLVPDER